MFWTLTTLCFASFSLGFSLHLLDCRQIRRRWRRSGATRHHRYLPNPSRDSIRSGWSEFI